MDSDSALKRAIEYHQSGQLQEAEGIYKKILKDNPNNADSLHLLGVIAHQSGENDLAIRLINRAIQNNPNNPIYYNNLGLSYKNHNQLSEAIACFKKVAELNPYYSDAYNNIGLIHKDQGNLNEAILNFKKAIRLKPKNTKAIYNLGIIFQKQGKYNDALSSYQKCLQFMPKHEKAYYNLGSVYQKLGKFDKALSNYKKTIELNPDNSDVYSNIGSILQEIGKLEEAIFYFKKALSLKPDDADLYNNLAGIYKDQCKLDMAISFYKKALELNPYFSIARSNLLFCMQYDPKYNNNDFFKEAKSWWHNHGKDKFINHIYYNSKNLSKKLKIGYISADFYQHSVSYFFLPLLLAHNRKQFEIFCYSEVIRPDKITDRIKNSADHYRIIDGRTDVSVAKQIEEDGIDILIDLSGHTAHNRLHVLAQKPSPIQVTWLGYPNTTGLPTINYRLTDNIADPIGEADKYHTEQLIRLPNGFLCYAPPDESPDIEALPALNTGRITFASCNNLAKINENVVAIWSVILQKVPKSTLLLKSRQLADNSTKDHFYNLFNKYGIPNNRIVMMPSLDSTYKHLALYNKVDICLDPFPYNGTTTTCEALWMGVPIITLMGNRHAGRVSASILHTIGLMEFVANTTDEYIKKAVTLTNNLDYLIKFKAGIRNRIINSPLCDAGSFACSIESEYKKIWMRWCSTT